MYNSAWCRRAEGFIPKHGGYKSLVSYKKAEVIYDATVHFCRRFIDRFDRTGGQMVQAARSGKQNIIEGSMDSGASREMEIKLTVVARGSLGELLGDFEDYLRVNGLKLWEKGSEEALQIRALSRAPNFSYDAIRAQIEAGTAETAANTILCLIHQATYLLAKQIAAQEQQFLKEGGLRENMTRARIQHRKSN